MVQKSGKEGCVHSQLLVRQTRKLRKQKDLVEDLLENQLKPQEKLSMNYGDSRM